MKTPAPLNQFDLLAEQMAHDIRSPLSVLEIISSSMHELPEEKRAVLKNSIDRIRTIANSLKAKTAAEAADTESPSTELASIIESLISEKRIEFSHAPQIKIDFHHHTRGTATHPHPADLKRILSNLINNSAEALSPASGGQGQITITITLTHAQNTTTITIKDNGRGIPPRQLKQIGKRGFTFGKTGGSGLGLHYAVKKIRSWGGSLRMRSSPNRGTTIMIELPARKP